MSERKTFTGLELSCLAANLRKRSFTSDSNDAADAIEGLRIDLAACQQVCTDLVRQKGAAVGERDEALADARKWYAAAHDAAAKLGHVNTLVSEYAEWHVGSEPTPKVVRALIDYAAKERL